jgi:hypothetical protein
MIKEKRGNDENDSLVVNFQIKEDPAEHGEEDVTPNGTHKNTN